MDLIDLHVHTNKSDGTLSPREVVELAIEKKLAAIAITDHDTVSGIDEAIHACQKQALLGQKLTIIPGVELSAAYQGRDIHLLGLLLDHKNKELINALHKTQEERNTRNEIMAARLRADGIFVSVEDLSFNEPDTVITRAHFARYLTQQGIVKSNAEAFDKYLGFKTKYYVKREYLTVTQAIDLILHAGGIPILAHPLLYHLTLVEVDQLVALLKDYGLGGIEALHSSNTGMDEGIIRRFVNKYNLLMTGGSDFHGTNKPLIELGSGRGNLKVPYSLLTKLYKWKEEHNPTEQET